MKVKESFWHEAAKASKNDQSSRANDSVRRNQFSSEQASAANKNRQSDSPLKDEMKFAGILESSAKPQKNQRQEDSGEERRDNRRREKKHAAEKESAELLAATDGKTEKNESYGGQFSGGGQSGFGANINQLNLSETFAARSILHIADLERLVSTIRSQINLGGRREIVLQLRRSVLEGLQVKILTDPAARVQIEFLAADEKTRSLIGEHSPELAKILRGRGINLSSLTTSLDSGGQNNDSSQPQTKIGETGENSETIDLTENNTFSPPLDDDKIYQA